MILYVDLEHRSLKERDPAYYDYVQTKRRKTASDLAKLSGHEVTLIHFSEINLRTINETTPSLIIISGHNTDLSLYEFEELSALKEFLRNPPCPIFTICGSFQLMVQIHGGRIAPIGKANLQDRSAEDPILPSDMLSENGYCPIDWIDDSPAPFTGMRTTSKMQQHHYWEVKELPNEFTHCARSEVTEFQAVTHETLPLAGVQFHPEEFNAENPAGRELLIAVIAWARNGAV